MKEMQPLVVEEGRFVFREKIDDFHVLAEAVHKIWNARILPGKIQVNDVQQMKTC